MHNANRFTNQEKVKRVLLFSNWNRIDNKQPTICCLRQSWDAIEFSIWQLDQTKSDKSKIIQTCSLDCVTIVEYFSLRANHLSFAALLTDERHLNMIVIHRCLGIGNPTHACKPHAANDVQFIHRLCFNKPDFSPRCVYICLHAHFTSFSRLHQCLILVRMDAVVLSC